MRHVLCPTVGVSFYPSAFGLIESLAFSTVVSRRWARVQADFEARSREWHGNGYRGKPAVSR